MFKEASAYAEGLCVLGCAQGCALGLCAWVVRVGYALGRWRTPASSRVMIRGCDHGVMRRLVRRVMRTTVGCISCIRVREFLLIECFCPFNTVDCLLICEDFVMFDQNVVIYTVFSQGILI